MTRATGDASTDHIGIRRQPVYMPPPRELTQPYADLPPTPRVPGRRPQRLLKEHPYTTLLVGATTGLLAGFLAKSLLDLLSAQRTSEEDVLTVHPRMNFTEDLPPAVPTAAPEFDPDTNS